MGIELNKYEAVVEFLDAGELRLGRHLPRRLEGTPVNIFNDIESILRGTNKNIWIYLHLHLTNTTLRILNSKPYRS